MYFDESGGIFYFKSQGEDASGWQASSGGGGGGGPNFGDDIVPAGAIDGVNTVYTLPNAPNPAGSLKLFKNGVRQTAGAGADYTLSGSSITYASALNPGDTHIADYRY